MTPSPVLPGKPGRTPWWIWPNLLGLDAPLVALAWLYAIGHAEDRAVIPAAAMALFLSVWTIYLVDRWLDAGKARSEPNLRHEFGKRYRRPLGIVAVGIGGAAALVAWFGLDYLMLGAGVMMAFFIALYFVVFVWLAQWPGKELGCGLGFAGGVLVAESGRLSDDRMSFVWFSLVAMATVNCFVIRFAEEERPSGPWIRGAAIGLALAVPLAFVLHGFTDQWRLELSLVLATLLLLGLWYLHHRGKVAPRSTRVLADVVIVAPLILVYAS